MAIWNGCGWASSTDPKQGVRAILESAFNWCGFGLLQTFGKAPSRKFCFQRGSLHETNALIMQLWSSHAKARYYDESHRILLEHEDADNGLIKVVRDSSEHSSKCTDVNFEEGGM